MDELLEDDRAAVNDRSTVIRVIRDLIRIGFCRIIDSNGIECYEYIGAK